MKLNKYVGGSIAALATAAVVVGSALPAHAEPVRPYSTAGSDTIQDVWNGLTNDGAPVAAVASYNAFDAINPAKSHLSQIFTKSDGTWFTRPSGSGEGVKALSAVWDSSTHMYGPTGGTIPAGARVALTHQELDFARSSSGPSGANDDLTYLPFARDAVSIAYFPTTGLTNLNLTTGQVTELYSGTDNASDSVVTFDGAGLPSINGVPVQPKIPQNGSGTRAFFLAAAGITTLASYIVDGTTPENDGAALTAPGDLIPYSAAQWIAQNNNVKGTVNNTIGKSIASLNGKVPTTGTAPTLVPGDLYGAVVGGNYTTPPVAGLGVFNRDTYSVIPSAFRAPGATGKQSGLVATLTSTGASAINNGASKAIIQKYGFGTLSYLTTVANYKHGSFASH